jgi:oligopeptide/dipeptide ABC transporter ATP-binding protein
VTISSASGLAPLLDVRHLTTSFALAPDAEGRPRSVVAIDDVSFAVPAGARVGLVGESGSGKSVTALSILRLLRSPPARLDRGELLFEGVDLARLDERALRSLRGNRLAMIFQEPMTSLNPVLQAGLQVAEPLELHRGLGRRAALDEAVSLFRLVGIADPERRVREYPHQLSGGMRQRVMIAMALACRPSLLVADEPTTALDVTIQAQILELLNQLSRDLGMSVLLITHDLGVVAESCDLVVVMYAGQVVERAPVRRLFASPQHPYTAGLLGSIPRLTGAAALRPVDGRRPRLVEIPGMVPRLDQLPTGCRFQERCPRVEARCRIEPPPLIEDGDAAVRCHLPLSGSG